MKSFLFKLSILFLLLICVFTCFIIVVNKIPKEAIAENVTKSADIIEKETLYPEIFGFKLFQLDNFTDSYMLNIAVAGDNNNPVESAMMNYSYKSDKPEFKYLALDTKDLAKGNTQNLSKKQPYGRYWHGYLVTLKPLLTILDYGEIRILNYILFTLLIVILFLNLKKIDSMYAYLFAFSLIIINFFIVPLSLQFSTVFYITLVSSILLLKYDILSKGNNLYCSFFIIGAITSYMDFLTTPIITLGIPLTIYILRNECLQKKWQRIICCGLIWLVGYSLLWAAKWGIAYLLTGNNILESAMTAAELRTSNLYKGMEMTIIGIFAFIWSYIKQSHLLGVTITAAILTIGVIILYFIYFLRSKKTLVNNLWLLLIAAMPICWFLVLRNHSIQHGWFTWRAIWVTVFAGLIFLYRTIEWNKHKQLNK